MKKSPHFLPAALAAIPSFIGGLFIARVLYEWLFPAATWLGLLVPVLLLALLAALLGLLIWRALASKISGFGWSLRRSRAKDEDTIAIAASRQAIVPFFPWWACLFYLISPEVDPIASVLFLGGITWLSIVLLAWILARPNSWKWIGPIFLFVALAPVYLLTLGQNVGMADTFEFQVVAPKLGIVHPTGYPLYLLLAKLSTFLPINSVAWRVNLASAIFALGAVTITFWLLWRLQRRPLAALLAALTFGLTPTFWSQAIEAEVYTLHALIVASALFLMREIGGWTLDQDHEETTEPSESSETPDDTRFLHRLRLFLIQPFGQTVLLAFVLGLGLTNHLTTLILIPAALLTILFTYRLGRYSDTSMRGIRGVVLLVISFLIPLVLYAYLPLRWQAVNGEPMGFSRFVDWVIGGRFQGALQLTAWLRDTARYGVVGRLLEYEWQPTFLLLSIVGAIWLFIRTWRYGLILFLAWLGFIFYNLNYYVPDLAVFLLPAVLIMAVWWGITLGAIFTWFDSFIDSSKVTAHHRQDGRAARNTITTSLLVTLLLVIGLMKVSERWSSIDASIDDGSTPWAEAVLSLPLDEGAAILADSDKFPPLYYLQQVEVLRPDLDILLLPDEQAYRSELEQRLNAGQQVYLARFLPGLQGIYHLGSEGPLTGVSTQPDLELPEGTTPIAQEIGPLNLLSYTVEPASPYGDGQIAVTFYWSLDEQTDELLHVYVRLVGDSTIEASTGRHPANNYNPTLVWEPGEIVSDFHLLDIPLGQDEGEFRLEVALAPPFTPEENLKWTSVAVLDAVPRPPSELQPFRAQIGPNFLDGIALPSQVRPQTDLDIILTGTGSDKKGMTFELRPAGSGTENNVDGSGDAAGGQAATDEAFVIAPHLKSGLEPGLYDVVVSYPGQESRCGWLSPKSSACSLGQIEVTDVSLPSDAHNFDDRIALTDIRLSDIELVPGRSFVLNLQWLALADVIEDYTVFVQILDYHDRIVGQVDSWPLQGTYPTSQWKPGEIIDDPFTIQLKNELSSGYYKLHIGFYLLETLQRLPVLDDGGDAVDDKVVVSGLYVP